MQVCWVRITKHDCPTKREKQSQSIGKYCYVFVIFIRIPYFIEPKDTTYCKILLIILNSKLISYYYKQISNVLGKALRFFTQYVEKIPIRLPNNTKPYEILTDYLLFLNAKEDWREKYKELINFFDKEISDSLIYELYFKEKIYNENKEYLLEAISKHLKPINYDKYAKLYWKKQLNNNLTKEEEKELKELEEQNLKKLRKFMGQ